MKKMNKKGFTIVELTVVIAVIAILAAVLIPTFSGIVKKANQSAVQQEAASIYKQIYALDLSDGIVNGEGDDGTSLSLDGFKVHTKDKIAYETHDYAVSKFAYFDSKKNMTATLDISDGTWEIKSGDKTTENQTRQ